MPCFTVFSRSLDFEWEEPKFNVNNFNLARSYLEKLARKCSSYLAKLSQSTFGDFKLLPFSGSLGPAMR